MQLGVKLIDQFAKLRFDDRPKWLKARERIGARLILAGHAGYLLMAKTNNPDNKHRLGEVLCCIVKEDAEDAPNLSEAELEEATLRLKGEWRTVWLPGGTRMGPHIQASNQLSVERGNTQVDQLLRIGTEVRFLSKVAPSTQRAYSRQLALMGGRLLRAQRQRPSRAGQIMTAYYEFRDSLGRPNGLISSQEMTKCARLIAAQTEIDFGMAKAIARRIEQFSWLWEELAYDVTDLLTNFPADNAMLYAMLEGMQLKPFKDGISFITWNLEQAQQPLDPRQLVADTMTAEYILAQIDFALSDIKHNAKELESLPLLSQKAPVPLPKVDDFGVALSHLEFHPAYAVLFERLVATYEIMAMSFAAKRYKDVAEWADRAQKLICNRLRLGNPWRQPMIYGGQLAGNTKAA